MKTSTQPNFRGQFKLPNQIKILNSDKITLKEGQQVLICSPTKKNVINYSTGEILGKKEKVVDIGVVEFKNGQLVIKPSQKSSKIIRKKVVRPNKTIRPSDKLYHPHNLIIKPLEE